MTRILFNLFSRLFSSNKIAISAYVINSKLNGYNLIAPKAYLKDSILGELSYIGRDSYIISSKIGKYCSIGSFVTTAIGKHPVDFIINHPSYYSQGSHLPWRSQIQFDFEELKHNKFQVEIGNFVWIGQDVTLLGGVQIGDGAIIAAGSVVTKSIPPYEIWGGSPIKKIRNRFSDLEVEQSKKIDWNKISKDDISLILEDKKSNSETIKKLLN